MKWNPSLEAINPRRVARQNETKQNGQTHVSRNGRSENQTCPIWIGDIIFSCLLNRRGH